jgi:hypothetical protein
MTLSQIRRRKELCMREIILLLEMNLKIYFFLDSFIHISILSKYRSTLLLGCRDPRGLPVHQQRPRPRGKNVQLIRYQFWCTRCAFRLLKSLQGYSGQKSWNPKKKNCEDCLKDWKDTILITIQFCMKNIKVFSFKLCCIFWFCLFVCVFLCVCVWFFLFGIPRVPVHVFQGRNEQLIHKSIISYLFSWLLSKNIF